MEENSHFGENLWGGQSKTYDDQTDVLSEETYEELIEQCVKDIIFLKENFDVCSYLNDSDILRVIAKLSANFHELQNAGEERSTVYSKRIGDALIEHKVYTIICQVIMNILDTGWINDDGEVNKKLHKPFRRALNAIFCYTDACVELRIKVCLMQNFLVAVFQALKIYGRKLTAQEYLHPTEESFLEEIIGLLFNCAIVDENKISLRELGLSSVLFDFTTTKSADETRLRALLTLASLLTEDESKKLKADMDGVMFLLQLLDGATRDVNMRSHGWSIHDLAGGVVNLANNDENKKMLVDYGVLPILKRMLILDGTNEQHVALRALHALSFEELNKEKIIKEPGLVGLIQDLKSTSPAQVVKNIAIRTLWNLREKLKGNSSNQKLWKLGLDLCKVETQRTPTSTSHVMISYNWTHQPLLLKVRDELRKNGYETWMDVDNMEGSTLEAMARGVENSDAVIICMSQQYKDSQFCRMEFEYAFKCKKLMVPLVMHPGYKADGWLGLVIGNMLYHDFSGRYSFDSRLQGVIKALGNRAKKNPGDFDKIDGPVKETTILPKMEKERGDQKNPSRDVVLNWSNEDMKTWLLENSFSEHPKIASLTGKDLTFLWNLHSDAPEFFYKLLDSQLCLCTIPSLSAFVLALNKLFK